MSSTIQAQVLGLAFGNNVLSAAPAGSLARADNVDVNASGLLEPRRGFTYDSQVPALGLDYERILSLGIFDLDSRILHYGTTKLYGAGGAGLFSGSFAAVSPTRARMRFVPAGGSIYFNTSTGTFSTTSVGVQPTEAGVPRAVELRANLESPSVATWFTNNTSVAYRFIISTKDAEGAVKQSEPSGRAVLRNRIVVPIAGLVRTGGTTVTLTLPVGAEHGLTTGDSFVLTVTEANFAAGTFTVASTPSDRSLTYADAGANVSSTVEHEVTASLSAALTAVLPSGLTTSHYIEVFRSEMTAASGDEPSDELYKVYEQFLTSTNISNGYVTFNDYCPESLLGDPLYTNPSEGGLLEANGRPPIGRDLAMWNGLLWLSNIAQRHRFELALLGVTAPNGLQNDWVFTIDSDAAAADVFTAKTTPGAANDFQLVTGLSTPALNIEATARALVQKINTISTTVYAYYVSGPEDPPGKILLEARSIGSAYRFYLSSTTSAPAITNCWSPQLPTALGGTAVSDDSAAPNGLAHSKPGQPFAFRPLDTVPDVGPKNSNLLRHIGQRETLYAFSDDGLYIITGGQPPFAVRKLAEAKCYAADSVVLLGEACWALTDQGVVRITEAGVTVVSRDIEPALTELFGAALNTVRQLAFAVAHESSRQYVLFLPTSSASTVCEQAYVFNTATRAWTRYTVSASCGVHDPSSDCLVLGAGDENRLLIQRNNRNANDYRDPEFSVTVVSSSGTTLTLASTTGITAGDQVSQGSALAIVDSVDSATQLTLKSTHTWSAAAATVYPGIACDAKFNPLTAGNPSSQKTFNDLSLLFQAAGMTEASVDTSTDMVPAVQTSTFTFGTYGQGPWGQFPWGNPHDATKRLAPIPNGQCAQLHVGLRTREAGAFWQLAGLTVEHQGGAGKPQR